MGSSRWDSIAFFGRLGISLIYGLPPSNPFGPSSPLHCLPLFSLLLFHKSYITNVAPLSSSLPPSISNNKKKKYKWYSLETPTLSHCLVWSHGQMWACVGVCVSLHNQVPISVSKLSFSLHASCVCMTKRREEGNEKVRCWWWDHSNDDDDDDVVRGGREWLLAPLWKTREKESRNEEARLNE